GRDGWVHHIPQMRLQRLESAFLVDSHQPAVAGHVGGQDSSEAALDGATRWGLAHTPWKTASRPYAGRWIIPRRHGWTLPHRAQTANQSRDGTRIDRGAPPCSRRIGRLDTRR